MVIDALRHKRDRYSIMNINPHVSLWFAVFEQAWKDLQCSEKYGELIADQALSWFLIDDIDVGSLRWIVDTIGWDESLVPHIRERARQRYEEGRTVYAARKERV